MDAATRRIVPEYELGITKVPHIAAALARRSWTWHWLRRTHVVEQRATVRHLVALEADNSGHLRRPVQGQALMTWYRIATLKCGTGLS